MLRSIDWQKVTDVSKELSDSLVRVKRSTTPLGMLDLTDVGITIPLNKRNYLLRNRHGLICHKASNIRTKFGLLTLPPP